MATAQTACELDPGSRETANVHRRAKVVASARQRGNDLFKASRFAEACAAYSEGLDKGEGGSAVLLCNRAACHAKLGRHEKAVEDCNGALAVRPGYSKARLRRADCNVKVFHLHMLFAALHEFQARFVVIVFNSWCALSAGEMGGVVERLPGADPRAPRERGREEGPRGG